MRGIQKLGWATIRIRVWGISNQDLYCVVRTEVAELGLVGTPNLLSSNPLVWCFFIVVSLALCPASGLHEGSLCLVTAAPFSGSDCPHAVLDSPRAVSIGRASHIQHSKLARSSFVFPVLSTY